MPYQGKVLWLNPDCIFIALDKPGDAEPRAIIFNHKKRQHYTPGNDSARLVLELLAKEGAQHGIHFDRLKDNILRKYSASNPNAALNNFLNQLEVEEILSKKDPDASNPSPGHVEVPETTPRIPWNSDQTTVTPGGTLMVLGYPLVYYKP